MWKDSVSFKKEGYAAAKMMRKWEIAEYHTDGAPGLGISQFVSNESGGILKRSRMSEPIMVSLQDRGSALIPKSHVDVECLNSSERDRDVDDVEPLDRHESDSHYADAITSSMLQEGEC